MWTKVALIASILPLANALSGPQPAYNKCDRRSVVSSVVGSASALLFGGDIVASAFANKISDQYDDRPKRRGPQPKDLGVSTRMDMYGEEFIGLKNCGPAPNCFCSTITDDPDHAIPAWAWPEDLGNEKEAAFQQLVEVLKLYPPGQNGVDGGGFEIKTFDPKTGYIYVQYEALKNGYYDDVEFAFIDGYGNREVQVRSSSRIGYLDFGVNAKRLNWIAKALRSKGWTAEGVDFKTHAMYASENNI